MCKQVALFFDTTYPITTSQHQTIPPTGILKIAVTRRYLNQASGLDALAGLNAQYFAIAGVDSSNQGNTGIT